MQKAQNEGDAWKQGSPSRLGGFPTVGIYRLRLVLLMELRHFVSKHTIGRL
jgi:hypothetical protein